MVDFVVDQRHGVVAVVVGASVVDETSVVVESFEPAIVVVVVESFAAGSVVVVVDDSVVVGVDDVVVVESFGNGSPAGARPAAATGASGGHT